MFIRWFICPQKSLSEYSHVNITLTPFLFTSPNRFAYKDEYEKFKLILTVILFAFSFTCRFLFSYRYGFPTPCLCSHNTFGALVNIYSSRAGQCVWDRLKINYSSHVHRDEGTYHWELRECPKKMIHLQSYISQSNNFEPLNVVIFGYYKEDMWQIRSSVEEWKGLLNYFHYMCEFGRDSLLYVPFLFLFQSLRCLVQLPVGVVLLHAHHPGEYPDQQRLKVCDKFTVSTVFIVMIICNLIT